jgi:UDP-galactopyranose mutase
VEIFERSAVVGGHSRCETLNGVVYEPNGPHIFHTNDGAVVELVRRFGMGRPFQYRVRTAVHLDHDEQPTLLSWPLQLDELGALPMWPAIAEELDRRPPTPSNDNFEAHVTDLIGPTLYELFIRHYTLKQWGRDPRTLSSSFAPKRVELRTDGDRRMFRDGYQFFEAAGCNSVIERLAAGAVVHAGTAVTMSDLVDRMPRCDAWVITAPLDGFLGREDELAWRGIRSQSTFHPLDDPHGTITGNYVINYPDARYPYTRTVETKHATGQAVLGSVVSQEFPGAPEKHYPVPTATGDYERRNQELKQEITGLAPSPVFFCGRLANYMYINQDEAIRQGIDGARAILRRQA